MQGLLFMDLTSIHVYGHVLSDEVLHSIVNDDKFEGNTEYDFKSSNVSGDIDYCWTSLRRDYSYFSEQQDLRDSYGTNRARHLISHLFLNLGYNLVKQTTMSEVNEVSYDITYKDSVLNDFPVIVVGNVAKDNSLTDLSKVNSLDFRAKGNHKQRSPHATMLAYLNNTEHTYGIISNGNTIRLLRSSGQLVKLSYIEFDLKKMIEEDKYTEFCLLYRILHATRFVSSLNSSCIFERWFNRSIESGNRIREGLSKAVQQTMQIIANAALQGEGEGNEQLRNQLANKSLPVEVFNKELIHLIYRLLFLFIIEDRKLIFALEGNETPEQLEKIAYSQDIYYSHYAASRLRRKSELSYLHHAEFHDLWEGLMDTLALFESGDKGEPLGIQPLGGKLFNHDTLAHLKQCTISNRDLLDAFEYLDQFYDDKGSLVRINYSSLDVEEFGSVYEGILEMHPVVVIQDERRECSFSYKEGFDRKSTSSYYTRPDLVQALIKTTLEPAIQERIKAHPGDKQAQIRALLAMRVCDPACGSGHFVLAMARTLAWYVCQLRTGEDNPASIEYRQALREVISKCVYAVDLNPDAVELCKVVLWIEGYCAGKPLSFLDHHIRCGNSVVGLGNDFEMLLNGVPNKAFKVNGCSKETTKLLNDFNKQAHKYYVEAYQSKQLGQAFELQGSLFAQDNSKFNIDGTLEAIGSAFHSISTKQGNTEADEIAKSQAIEHLKASEEVKALYNAANIYTYAFFREFTDNDLAALKSSDNFTSSKGNLAVVSSLPYTATVFQVLEDLQAMTTQGDSYQSTLNAQLVEQATQAAKDYKFFHWALEFPDIYVQGGFDVMCGNPPWAKIKIEERSWFEQEGEFEISSTKKTDEREAKIKQLQSNYPALWRKWQHALLNADRMSAFLRLSDRFKLTAQGDINLYPLFAEHSLNLCRDRWGIIVPTGIATDDSNKQFFQHLTQENRLSALYDFENRSKIFAIDSRFRFCLLSAQQAQPQAADVSVGFMLTELEQILDTNRVFTLQTSDFAKFNPNTKTCPIFRTSYDADLTSKIYDNSAILLQEATAQELQGTDLAATEAQSNPWRISFFSMFHMSGDSALFRTFKELSSHGAEQQGSNFKLEDITYVPLLEAKLFWQYNHHFAAFDNALEQRPNSIDNTAPEDLANVDLPIKPWYWIAQGELDKKLQARPQDECKFAISFRCLARNTDSRTFITSILPSNIGIGHSAGLAYSRLSLYRLICLLAIFNSLCFDFVVRQKLSGTNISHFILKQLPVPHPDQIEDATQWQLVKRVAELTYFNHDMDDFAQELSEQLSEEQNEALGERLVKQEPWVFNDKRRAQVQAEIDAIVAKLYGLNDEDVRYILDPEDVVGKGCINETFRVLKESELRDLGEYRTKRLVLEAWDKLKHGILD